MREIKFRGKDINGNWHYGLLTHDETPSFKSDYKWFISNSKGKPYAYGVIEETIEQFTGLHDKNGVEIYEGDVVKIFNLIGVDMFEGDVVYNENDGCFELRIEDDDREVLFYTRDRLEVIGNIHEEVAE